MIKRILENWLDNASEKSLQIPFCYMLENEGYQILHITRHSSMEMGKDIIAISPRNVPCAFQLKSGTGRRLTLDQWNKLRSQIDSLMLNKIVHPSIKSNAQHESWFVTNKNLDEEVSNSIDQMNRGWIDRGQPELQLKTLVRGELLKKANKLREGLWPTELVEVRNLLELYLEDGLGTIPKEKFVKLLESVLPIHTTEKISKENCKRAISACALACALSTMSFSNKDNHFAIIEAWTLYSIYTLAIAERYTLSNKHWLSSFQIASQAIYNSLSRLCDEIIGRNHLVEGNPCVDVFFYRYRMTILIALLSIYGLWRIREKEQNSEHDEFIREFCTRNNNKMLLWGEYAIPQFLAFYWYFRNVDSTIEPDFMIAKLIMLIANQRSDYSNKNLPDPYFTYEELILDNRLLEYSFKNYSYMLESLVHLLVRTNMKQTMKKLWPSVTRLAFESFKVEKKWHYYLWRNEKGTQVSKCPPLTQKWENLKSQALDDKGKNLPKLLKKYPILFLIFLCVCPHRTTPESVRWLDSNLFRK